MTIHADPNDDAEALRTLVRRIMLSMHTTIPAVVVSYFTSNDIIYARLQVAIRQVEDIEGERRNADITELDKVPVILPYAQQLGLSMTLPIKPGDEGMIHFCEREIDGWQEFGGVQSIQSLRAPRAYDLTDAVFVPGAISKPMTIQDYSTDAIEIRNADASVKYRISPDELLMKAGEQSIRMPGDGNIYIVGNIIHEGNTEQTGESTSTDGYETPADVKAGAISLKLHKHPITSGSSSPGPTGSSVP